MTATGKHPRWPFFLNGVVGRRRNMLTNQQQEHADQPTRTNQHLENDPKGGQSPNRNEVPGKNQEKTMNDAIIINNVYKKFGRPKKRRTLKNLFKRNGKASANGTTGPVVAVDRISFSVKEGEIFGVLGPNGSGKSTLIRLMSTLLLPDEGSITILGQNPETDALAVQQLINRVSVEASFFKKLSPMENLMYGARLYGMGGKEVRKRVVEILTRLGLEERSIFSPMEEMSRGMQQKVAIARALLSRPRILLLDEPTTGLDPVSKREVQAVVRELQEQDGTTILLTTHDMAEAEKLCSRVAIMHKGKIVALDTPEALRQMVPQLNGHTPTLEDVFIHLTGDKLKEEQKENLESAEAVVKVLTQAAIEEQPAEAAV
jgi:ABC-2 type transport system ATP-binding protein